MKLSGKIIRIRCRREVIIHINLWEQWLSSPAVVLSARME